MKNILIATPCLYQKVDAYYTHSLCESIKLGLKHDLDIRAIFLSSESILPIARNELLNLAYKKKYDSMVFIDDDECWDEEALIEILLSEKDVISLPVVNKSDKEIQYNVWVDKSKEIDPLDGYVELKQCGTGFLKLSKKVIADLWESNPKILTRQNTVKNVFEYSYSNDIFYGEDVVLSKKLKELGYKIWLNPKSTVSHIGLKMYKGKFEL